mgnify:CR=1 FL=1
MLLAKFSQEEWELIQALPSSLSLRRIAKRISLSPVSVWRIYKKLYEKGKFYYVFDTRRFGLCYLAVISTYPGNGENAWPQGTLTVRKIWGLKPYTLFSALIPCTFISEYVKSLNADVVTVVRGLEIYWWRPDSGGSILMPGKGLMPFLSKTLEELYFKEKHAAPPRELPDRIEAPDPIDLAILVKKLQAGPFAKPIEGIKYAASIDPLFPRVSEKTVSYHYRKHVLPGWLYNTFIPYLPINDVPLRVFYFEGREAPALARILINLPYFITALVDVNASLLTGQTPPWMMETVYRVISSFDVEAPLCQLVMSSRSIAKFIPHLWKFLKETRRGWTWHWPKEKVRIVQKKK